MKFLVNCVFLALLVSSAGRVQKGADFAWIPSGGEGKCTVSEAPQPDCPSDEDTPYRLGDKGSKDCPDDYVGVTKDECVEAFFKFACAESLAGRKRCVWLPSGGFQVISNKDQLPGCYASTYQEDKGWKPKFNEATNTDEGSNANYNNFQRLCKRDMGGTVETLLQQLTDIETKVNSLDERIQSNNESIAEVKNKVAEIKNSPLSACNWQDGGINHYGSVITIAESGYTRDRCATECLAKTDSVACQVAADTGKCVWIKKFADGENKVVHDKSQDTNLDTWSYCIFDTLVYRESVV